MTPEQNLAKLIIDFFEDNDFIKWDVECDFSNTESFCCDMFEHNGCIRYKVDCALNSLKENP